ncbi:MAG: hypothetical protein D6689_02475 [Deltaproteobacteria bacterium]|nr:MAG: hypothetical protein D6689_02475 [Deltaproteobacteria bacterium]
MRLTTRSPGRPVHTRRPRSTTLSAVAPRPVAVARTAARPSGAAGPPSATAVRDPAPTAADSAAAQTTQRNTGSTVGVLVGARKFSTGERPRHRDCAIIGGCRTRAPRHDRDTPRDRNAVAAAAREAGVGAAVSGAPDELIGRDEPLRALERAARAARDGAVVVEIRGPSGIGKTALADCAARRWAARGAAVWWLRCYERGPLAASALDALLAHIAAFAGAAADPVADGAALAWLRSPRTGGLAPVDPAHAARALAAVRAVAAAAARRAPLAIVVDDAQWLDADTRRALAAIVRPPEPPRVLVLLAVRSGGGTGSADLGVDVRTLELAPLALADAADLARRLLGRDARDLADAIAAEAGGNPYFVRALAAFVRASGRGASLSVALDDVLHARARDLGADCRALVELVCAAGEPVSERVLAASTGRGVRDVRADLAGLQRADLVVAAGAADIVEPFHDRVRQAFVGAAGAERLRQLHRSLAVALDRTGEGGDLALARHYFAAGVHDRAAHHALRGADAARASLQFDRAAELYRMAVRLGSFSDEEERRIQLALAECLGCAGRPADAARAYRSAADGAAGAERIDLLRRAAEELLRGGYVREGRAALDDVLRDVGLAPVRGGRAALATLVARRAWLRARGLTWRPRRRTSDRDRLRADACWSAAVGLSMIDTVRAADFQARHLALALRLGDPARIARGLAMYAGHLAAQGAGRRARQVLSRAEAAADAADDLHARALVQWAHGAVHYFVDNDWRAALDRHDAALAGFRALAAGGWEVDTVELYACLAALFAGDLRGLERRVRAAAAACDVRGDRYGAVSLRSRFILVWLLAGDAEVARAELEAALASWDSPDAGFQLQHWFAMLGRADVALYAGEARAAAGWIAQALPLARRARLLRLPMLAAQTLYLQGRAALALGDAAIARRVARQLARVPVPVAAPWAGMLRGGAAALDGARAAAGREWAKAAHDLAGQGTSLHAAVARLRCGQIAGDAAGARAAAAARTWLRDQKVRDPDALARMLLPVTAE